MDMYFFKHCLSETPTIGNFMKSNKNSELKKSLFLREENDRVLLHSGFYAFENNQQGLNFSSFDTK